jgi:hypothetical protein
MAGVNDLYTKKTGQLDDNSNVSQVVLGGFTLPYDVIITINGNKIIAQSQILDGVAVFERVTRKPVEIEFDFVMRSKNTTQRTATLGSFSLPLAKQTEWVFPLTETSEMMQKIWIKDQVLEVDNVYLNKLGIKQVILQDIQLTTIRGKTDVPVRIKAIEDYYSTKQQGTTLII